MSLPRKKSRGIRVSGLDYRYQISTTRLDEDWNYALNVTIQIAHGHGSALRVSGLVTRDFWLDFSDFRKDLTDAYPVVLPNHVEAFIREGMRNGWAPETSGPAHILKVENRKIFL